MMRITDGCGISAAFAPAFQLVRRISRRRPASSNRRCCSSVSGITGGTCKAPPFIHRHEGQVGRTDVLVVS